MQTGRRRAHRRRGNVALAAAVVAVVAVASACVITTTPVTYPCEVNPNHFLLPTTTGSMDNDYKAAAPATVVRNATFTQAVQPAVFSFPGANDGNGAVTQLTNLVWRVKIPAGATLVAATIGGGQNLGPGTPTVAVSGGNVVLTVPGPMLPDTDIALPAVLMELRATGAVGSQVAVTLGGTSYASPGLSFNTRVTGTLLGTLNPTLRCYPSPSPTLATTQIVAA